MQLEDYFEFLDPDDIRIKGHRINLFRTMTCVLSQLTC